MDGIFNHFLTISLIAYNFLKNQYFFNQSFLNESELKFLILPLLSIFIIFLLRFRILNTFNATVIEET